MTLLLAAAFAASAPTDANGQATATTQAAPEKARKPKRVCKSVRRTGSNLSRSVCKTEQEWANDGGAGMQSLELIDQSYKAQTGNGAVD
ncbi:hypothetical protein [Sphingopyxis sp. LK2115]|jgi:hypothetical protein|uniref:hypothetical protein n=1 Tax=Sphingopyxis sp. LK2115 TaxID=2744558 RepID=UPI001660E4E6|nr:hypothetical protein [Sphingopyxis sp. LK2115]